MTPMTMKYRSFVPPMNIISAAIRQMISVAETWLSRKTSPAMIARMPANGRKP